MTSHKNTWQHSVLFLILTAASILALGQTKKPSTPTPPKPAAPAKPAPHTAAPSHTTTPTHTMTPSRTARDDSISAVPEQSLLSRCEIKIDVNPACLDRQCNLPLLLAAMNLIFAILHRSPGLHVFNRVGGARGRLLLRRSPGRSHVTLQLRIAPISAGENCCPKNRPCNGGAYENESQRQNPSQQRILHSCGVIVLAH